MESRYNIYFEGQLLDGQDLGTVRAKLAKLFKANDATLDKLFSGKAQLIKKNCDKSTALKYKQAMEQAGAVPLVREAPSAASADATSQQEPAAATPQKLTAAERIAALAAAPEGAGFGGAEPDQPREQAPPAPAEPGSIELAPEDTEVLRPEERAQPEIREVDTAGIELDESGQALSGTRPAPPPAPDTSHLSMGAVGETIPGLPSDQVPLDPDTDGIDLAPAGTDFSDCALPEVEAPGLDLSGIELAPSGSPVLAGKERKPPPASPNTDHIALEE